jgi:hypothetical protein
MKSLLMALVAVCGLAVVGPVYAGGADSDGVGYHCYIFGEREDTVEHNFRKNYWQFMAHDEDPTQLKTDVLKKVAKATAKGFEITMSVGNLPLLIPTSDPKLTLEVCSPPDEDECPPEKKCTPKPGPKPAEPE